MNKTLIFFCLSTAILALSIIVICISPIINNIKVETYSWSFSKWRTLNCKYLADKENSEDVSLDNIQKFKKMKNLCNRKKAMHDLEFAALIINLVLGFVCANFSLLHYLDVGKDFEKKTGIIGFVTGIIGFVITLIYVSYSGYIFNNDIAYGEFDYSTDTYSGEIDKLYSNGADYKWDGTQFIHVYENDKTDYSQFAKFKDLGGKQYNYNSQFYKTFTSSSSDICKTPSSMPSNSPSITCQYFYSTSPFTSFENKDLYDRWLTTLILSVLIVACNIGLLIFGFLIFKSGNNSNEAKTVAII